MASAGPITVEEARSIGVTWDQLQGPRWRRLGAGVYAPLSAAAGPLLTLRALARRLPATAAFSGATAGWLHGLDMAPCLPVEVTVPRAERVAARLGAVVRRRSLPATELTRRGGLQVTSPIRTAMDLGSRIDIVEAVAGLDAALHAQLTDVACLRDVVAACRGQKGIGRLRRALDLAEPATESPMETRLRLLLVTAGLPRPEAQVSLYDQDGGFIGRPDFLYRHARLVIEFDGATHRDTLVADNRRQNRFLAAGYRMLRFTGPDVLGNPDDVVRQVRLACKSA